MLGQLSLEWWTFVNVISSLGIILIHNSETFVDIHNSLYFSVHPIWNQVVHQVQMQQITEEDRAPSQYTGVYFYVYLPRIQIKYI